MMNSSRTLRKQEISWSNSPEQILLYQKSQLFAAFWNKARAYLINIFAPSNTLGVGNGKNLSFDWKASVQDRLKSAIQNLWQSRW